MNPGLRSAVLAGLGLALGAGVSGADEIVSRVLSRLAEEAGVFERVAPNTLAEETLRQKALKARPRFRPRVGAAAGGSPPPRFQNREIVSEYGFAALKDSPNVLHELRQVISVDGRQVKSREKARQALAAGMKSSDDRLKRRLLEEFERHGLVGAAADFGQVILLFAARRQAEYEFRYRGEGRIGPEQAYRLDFRQTGGQEALTVFEGRKVVRRPIEGEIWARKADLLPLEIRLTSSRERGSQKIRDEANVDYAMSPHGALVPVSVVHRQFEGSVLAVENVFSYSAFRMFSADTEIKFNEVPKESLP